MLEIGVKTHRLTVFTKDDKALHFMRATYPSVDDSGNLVFRDFSRSQEVIIPERNLSYVTIEFNKET